MKSPQWSTTGAEQMVSTLWAAGLSASQIMVKLRDIGVLVSRNAVISKIHRLGLAGRENPSRTYGRLPKRPRKPKLIALAKFSAPAIVRDERPSSRKPPAPSTTSIRFLDLKPGQCKMFCEGEEGPDGLCCGKEANGSWCFECWRVVRAPANNAKKTGVTRRTA